MSLFKVHRLIFCFSALLLVSLPGCMKVSDLGQNAAFLPPQQVEESIGDALKTPYFKQGDWPTLNWWEAFNDSELALLIEAALEQNPNIQSVQQKIEVAKQLTTKQKSTLFPSIFFGGHENYAYQSKNSFNFLLNPDLARNFNNIHLNFGFEYEFDFWGKYSNLFRAALGREQAQKAEYKQVKLIVSTAIAQAYFALKTSMAKKRLYLSLYQLKSKSLNLSKLLYNKALYSKIEPATYKQELDEVEKMIATIDAEIALGKDLVNILRGQGPDSAFEISDTFDRLPKEIEIPKDLSSDLLIRRPDLLAAIWRVEASAYDANAAVADFFPRINLLGLMGVESMGFKNLMNWQSGGMGLYPSFHIPIFKAGAIRANLKMKKAELEGAIYDYNALLLKSLQEVTDFLALTTSWYQKKRIQTNILENARLKVYLVNLRSKRGIDNLLQVYLEETDEVNKEIQDVQISYNQYISIINLIKSLGGGFTDADLMPLKIHGVE